MLADQVDEQQVLLLIAGCQPRQDQPAWSRSRRQLPPAPRFRPVLDRLESRLVPAPCPSSVNVFFRIGDATVLEGDSGRQDADAPLLTVRDGTFGPKDGTLLGVIAFFDPAAVTDPVQVDATFDDISFTPLPERSGKGAPAAARASDAADWSAILDLLFSEQPLGKRRW